MFFGVDVVIGSFDIVECDVFIVEEGIEYVDGVGVVVDIGDDCVGKVFDFIE